MARRSGVGAHHQPEGPIPTVQLFIIRDVFPRILTAVELEQWLSFRSHRSSQRLT